MKDYNPIENFEKVKCSTCRFLNTNAMFTGHCHGMNFEKCYQKYLEEQNKQMLEILIRHHEYTCAAFKQCYNDNYVVCPKTIEEQKDCLSLNTALIIESITGKKIEEIKQ